MPLDHIQEANSQEDNDMDQWEASMVLVFLQRGSPKDRQLVFWCKAWCAADPPARVGPQRIPVPTDAPLHGAALHAPACGVPAKWPVVKL